jgi:hypothetical protein
MKITNDDMITTIEWGSIGSSVGCVLGTIATQCWQDVGIAGPTFGFALGTVIGAVAGFISSTGVMTGSGKTPVAIGGKSS